MQKKQNLAKPKVGKQAILTTEGQNCQFLPGWARFTQQRLSYDTLCF